MGMGYVAMMECKVLIDDNYRADLISAETYHTAIKGLHQGFAESNGFRPCVCLSCNR